MPPPFQWKSSKENTGAPGSGLMIQSWHNSLPGTDPKPVKNRGFLSSMNSDKDWIRDNVVFNLHLRAGARQHCISRSPGFFVEVLLLFNSSYHLFSGSRPNSNNAYLNNLQYIQLIKCIFTSCTGDIIELSCTLKAAECQWQVNLSDFHKVNAVKNVKAAYALIIILSSYTLLTWYTSLFTDQAFRWTSRCISLNKYVFVERQAGVQFKCEIQLKCLPEKSRILTRAHYGNTVRVPTFNQKA